MQPITDHGSYLTLDAFSHPLTGHGFSTRIGGVSQGDVGTLNLNFRKEAHEPVLKNYQILAEAMGFVIKDLAIARAHHTTEIRKINQDDPVIGLVPAGEEQKIDGLVTDVPGVVLMTYFADCVPLLLLDPEKKAIGLAHAGWKGTLADMAGKMVRRMVQEYESDPKTLRVAIGPHILGSCYEVEGDVADPFLAHYPKEDHEKIIRDKGLGKFLLNLDQANRRHFLQAGVYEKNIISADLCPHCRPDLLYSHRVQKGTQGNFGAFFWLKKTGA